MHNKYGHGWGAHSLNGAQMTRWFSDMKWHDSGFVWGEKMILNKERGSRESMRKGNRVISNVLMCE